MPYGTPTRGTWAENLSAAPTITIPSHSAGDLLLLYFAGFADEDTTTLTADGWTRVSGADYIEGSLWNAVWEKLGNGSQTSVTVTDASVGGGGVCVVQPGGDVGCTLVYNDDNTSNTQAVFTATSGAGYRIGFAPIYGARTISGTPISLVSGSATHTSSVLGGNFLSTFSGTYRLAVAVFDVTAATSAVFGINWTTGNSSSNGLMVLVPEKVTGITGTAASTLSPISQAASGAVAPPAFTGTAASTLGSLTQVASGTTAVPAYTGTGASTLTLISQAATGTRTVPAFTGTAASTLGALGQAATGTAAVPNFTGTAASTLGALLSAAGGSVGPAITGIATSTLTPISQAAMGSFFAAGFIGTGASTLSPISQTATGARTVPDFAGPATSTLGSISQTATGTRTVPAYMGTGASTLGSIGQSATGTRTVPSFTGAATSALGSLSQVASGTYAAAGATGTATSTLTALTQAAAGTFAPPSYDGVATSTLDPLTQAALGMFGRGAVPDDRTAEIESPQWTLRIVDERHVTIPPVHRSLAIVADARTLTL